MELELYSVRRVFKQQERTEGEGWSKPEWRERERRREGGRKGGREREGGGGGGREGEGGGRGGREEEGRERVCV